MTDDNLQSVTDTYSSSSHLEELSRILFEKAADGMFLTGPRGRLLAVNARLTSISGYSRDELLGMTSADLILSAPLAPSLVGTPVALYEGAETDERRIRHRDGTILSAGVTVHELSEGALLWILRDLSAHRHAKTDRVQAAIYHISEAAQSTLGLDDLFAAIHTTIARLMPAHNFYIALYEAATGMIRFPYYADEFDTTPPPQKLGRGLTEFVLRTGSSLLATPALFDQLVRSGQVESLGAPSVDWLGVPLKTQQGETIGVMAVQTYTQDVRLDTSDQEILEFVSTQVAMAIERKRAVEALQRSEEKYRLLVESLSDVIFTVDTQGILTYISPAIERYSGFPAGQVIGQPFTRFIHPDDLPGLVTSFGRSLAGQPEPFEFRVYSRDGTIRHVRTSSQMLVEEGQVVGLTGIMSDVTASKRAEEERARLQVQLFQAQKMELLGRLAGGVAHDFNNMLLAILGHAELAMRRCPPSDPIRADLKVIEESGHRSAGLVRQLLAFARQQTVAPRVLDLNDTVTGMLRMLRRLIGEDIDLVWVPGPGVWPVKIDPTQIDQLLANLCVNARDAIAGVGKVTIETTNATFDDAYCALHPGFVSGEYVMLAVSDDGCGMTREVIDHLFEPFFSTKEMGKGTGLGLATVYGIVRQNDGFINVYSEPGRGSTFKIYLPRLAEQPVQLAAPAPREMATGLGETLLLVEDEPAILKIARAMLQELGYRVLAAGTPGEALLLAESRTAEIDLLITDVVMPEMSGRDLAKSLSEIKPALRILFTSGYTGDVIAHRGVLDKGVHFLQKPFSIEDLASKVREVLDQS
ncbi:MAG TPA: PAS domain S-box protein [Anaerolineae bacterium]|nr:PAS domain S-box protein [Anaerolineae bacterium]